MIVPFNKPALLGSESQLVTDAIASGKLSGGGGYMVKCEGLLQAHTNSPRVLITPSCTAALEIAALLLDLQPGDEVIMPSFTFVSTANAFVLRGAVPVFVDIDPKTFNIDPNLIRPAVTKRTKAIVVVHYAGVSCEMDDICAIADFYGIPIIEDAAQGIGSSYKLRPLGSIGRFGCYSFHETKNLTCGEGGAIVLNNPADVERAEIIREKGTNRSKYFRGQVDKYTWVDIGSSYLTNEITAAFLYAQLSSHEKITEDRRSAWNRYYNELTNLRKIIQLPIAACDTGKNGHIFPVLERSLVHRDNLINQLRKKNVEATFHYIPLHSTTFGRAHCRQSGSLFVTEDVSSRICRLPIWYRMGIAQTVVIDALKSIYEPELNA